jgi:hypothetical protein
METAIDVQKKVSLPVMLPAWGDAAKQDHSPSGAAHAPLKIDRRVMRD